MRSPVSTSSSATWLLLLPLLLCARLPRASLLVAAQDSGRVLPTNSSFGSSYYYSTRYLENGNVFTYLKTSKSNPIINPPPQIHLATKKAENIIDDDDDGGDGYLLGGVDGGEDLSSTSSQNIPSIFGTKPTYLSLLACLLA